MKPNWKALAEKYRQMHLGVLRHYGDSLRALMIRFDECKQERDEWKAKYTELLDRHIELQEIVARKEERR